jgi:hypothetical protein
MYRTLFSQQWIHKNNLEELFVSASSDQKSRRTSKLKSKHVQGLFWQNHLTNLDALTDFNGWR